MNYQDIAKRVVMEEAEALSKLTKELPKCFNALVNHILNLKGRVILSGIGKSGYIARKIAASLASTGTPSLFIHPAEASHGDLGMVTENDLVFMLSNSGETKELYDTINYCKRYDIKIIGMTMKEGSTLATNSNFLLLVPANKEASLIAAPTTSALMMLSLGDALMVALHEAKGFSKDNFKIFHPGGKIGTNLIKIQDLMYTKNKLPLVKANTSLTKTILIMTEKSLGCALVIDSQKKLLGIITDGDLRRHIEDDIRNITAKEIMTKNPATVAPEYLATEALHIMNTKSITALPVAAGKNLIGIIHIHDILRAGVG